FIRTFYRDSWSSWREVYHSGNISTANAATATKLHTARTITIGNTGKSFDGSADVSWSLDEIGAAAYTPHVPPATLQNNTTLPAGFYT
ncbi:hypothetical protein NL385_27115, partial [Klebsiella pneumoniae]|nr:hypothetical protein [Klebsiella pneumoniae]